MLFWRISSVEPEPVFSGRFAGKRLHPWSSSKMLDRERHQVTGERKSTQK
jgi:hypothetical protein